jgi:hypothetical protein
MHYENNENNDRKQERRQKIHKHKKKSPSFYDEEDLSHNRIKKEYKKIKETFDDEEWEDWDKYYNH